MQPTRSRRPLGLELVPEILRPLIRAYLLGYASAVAPRLLTLILQHVVRRRRKYISPEQDEHTFLESGKHILRTGLEPQRFPTFCAVLVGGSTLLQVCPPFENPYVAGLLYKLPFSLLARVSRQHQLSGLQSWT